jgi:hypothetical protein
LFVAPSFWFWVVISKPAGSQRWRNSEQNKRDGGETHFENMKFDVEIGREMTDRVGRKDLYINPPTPTSLLMRHFTTHGVIDIIQF